MLPRFELTTLVLFDAGAVIQVWEEAAKFGRKAMVVTYTDIRRQRNCSGQ